MYFFKVFWQHFHSTDLLASLQEKMHSYWKKCNKRNLPLSWNGKFHIEFFSSYWSQIYSVTSYSLLYQQNRKANLKKKRKKKKKSDKSATEQKRKYQKNKEKNKIKTLGKNGAKSKQIFPAGWFFSLSFPGFQSALILGWKIQWSCVNLYLLRIWHIILSISQCDHLSKLSN